MTELIRCKKEDYEQAMDLMDFVFSKAGTPHDFASLLPRLYKPSDESMKCQFGLRENGRLMCVVGFFPLCLNILGTELSCFGVGNVATHPRAAKKGYMSAVMEYGIKTMREEGIALSLLGGQRQRYGYFGYETGGQSVIAQLTRTNIRHTMPGFETQLALRPLEANDAELLAYACRIYKKQPFYNSLRTETNIYEHFISWHCRPYAIFKNGEPAGYLVANSRLSEICELVCENDGDIVPAAITFVTTAAADGRADIVISPWQAHKYAALFEICERVSSRGCENWRINDWRGFVGAFLSLKATYTPLCDGKLVFSVGDYGHFEICVQDGKPSVQTTEAAADIELDGRSAVRLMLSPVSDFTACSYPACQAMLLRSWFPLPVDWKSPDGV